MSSQSLVLVYHGSLLLHLLGVARPSSYFHHGVVLPISKPPRKARAEDGSVQARAADSDTEDEVGDSDDSDRNLWRGMFGI